MKARSRCRLSSGTRAPALSAITLNVPPSVPTFDLFATTIDLYQGVTDPYQGHTIAVLSDVTGPAEPSAARVQYHDGETSTQTITCIGHGSVTGSVGNANLGTSVVLSKQNVQITNSLVQNQAPNTGPNNLYSFCVPADTYQVQEWQLPTPDPIVTPTSMPTPAPGGSLATVTIPPPLSAGGATPTPTPAIKCPTTCQNPDGTCPGICSNVIQPL